MSMLQIANIRAGAARSEALEIGIQRATSREWICVEIRCIRLICEISALRWTSESAGGGRRRHGRQ